MKISLVEVSLKLPAPPTVRSRGVHLSSIIRSIAGATGILKPEYIDSAETNLYGERGITDPAAILRMSIGLAWEAWYIPQILSQEQGVQEHPGEMVVDGVYMTPDGESVDVIITSGRKHIINKIHEVKATYKSTNTVGDLSREWMWITQMAGYCKGACTKYACMHVLFLCGDYKMPIVPQLKCWDVEFTQAEIDTRWAMLTEYRDFKESDKP